MFRCMFCFFEYFKWPDLVLQKGLEKSHTFLSIRYVFAGANLPPGALLAGLTQWRQGSDKPIAYSQFNSACWSRPLCWWKWQQLPQTNVQSTIELGLAIAADHVMSNLVLKHPADGLLVWQIQNKQRRVCLETGSPAAAETVRQVCWHEPPQVARQPSGISPWTMQIPLQSQSQSARGSGSGRGQAGQHS